MDGDTTSQDIPDRRVYVMLAKPELLARTQSLHDEVLVDTLATPHVVMTEELPFEGYLEGWRSQIQVASKLKFLEDLLGEYCPFETDADARRVLGSITVSEELFDKWWIAEEAEYTELERSSWRT